LQILQKYIPNLLETFTDIRNIYQIAVGPVGAGGVWAHLTGYPWRCSSAALAAGSGWGWAPARRSASEEGLAVSGQLSQSYNLCFQFPTAASAGATGGRTSSRRRQRGEAKRI